MQATDFKKYSENPALLNKQSILELQQLVKDFPYFQSAHILLSLASKKWDASLYQQSLKKTAIIVTNRAHLFHLIHKLEQTEKPVLVEEKEIPKKEVEQPITQVQTENPEPVKQELDILKTVENDATTEKAEESEFLEKEIAKQVVNSFVEKEIIKTPELHKPEELIEPESFGDWLALLKKNNGQPYEEIKEQKEKAQQERKKAKQEAETKLKETTAQKKQRNWDLIDQIIEKNPGAIRVKEDQKFFVADQKAKESLRENEHLVTETLAKIYALQGNVNKAIRAYEILSLRFPQKSAYFAALIKKLKE